MYNIALPGNHIRGHSLGESRGLNQMFCDDSTIALVIKSVTLCSLLKA